VMVWTRTEPIDATFEASDRAALRNLRDQIEQRRIVEHELECARQRARRGAQLDTDAIVHALIELCAIEGCAQFREQARLDEFRQLETARLLKFRTGARKRGVR